MQVGHQLILVDMENINILFLISSGGRILSMNSMWVLKGSWLPNEATGVAVKPRIAPQVLVSLSSASKTPGFAAYRTDHLEL